MMVPFYNTTFSHTIAWAREGVEQMGMNNLYALELGNEPTFYPWFSIEEYVTRFKNLQGRLIDAIPSLGDKRIFQAFDTASYSAGDLKTKPTFESGLNAAAPSIKQVAYHYYQNQHGIANWGNFQEYIRHTSTKSNLTNFLPNIKYLEEDHSAIEFAFTEAGYTVGGKGDKEHVIKANNFASALWSLDFQLCAMSMNVSRTNWQQIVRSDLQMWRPVKTSLGGPRVTAHFYSQPFVADFIGKSGKTQVVELDVGMPHNGLYAGYGAYDNGKLARVALLNLELWDQKRSSGDRPSAKFSLSGLKNAGRKVMVHHLNAEKGALAQNGMTYAGLQWTWASKGKQKKVKDDSRILDFVDSKVDIMVNATQAVLLEIQ
ncbi:hypothetical protein F5B22DRAFT_596601 [Xylaria bambusicola]|uniref:uncharacterized protein n=1 Tax=Xylaria bambusicola TaxID=326684 RepID=UPI002008A7B1|nr:uncharacterized protein F5B22DRAFT_596601 [Xylaria bambusicola]KAI0521354.1 hypothetical protein F5B22DRAFT_596601 [Xylaria bambusicola]